MEMVVKGGENSGTEISRILKDPLRTRRRQNIETNERWEKLMDGRAIWPDSHCF